MIFELGVTPQGPEDPLLLIGLPGQSRAASLPAKRFAGATHGRIPSLAATVGTTAIVVSLRDWRKPSYPPKKKVLSFLIGPPRTPPNWFRWNGGRSALPSPS